MRMIGVAGMALAAMAGRLQSRVAFGKAIAGHSIREQRVARARIDIEMTRLLCLKAADRMARAGDKAAQGEIAMIKVQAPAMAFQSPFGNAPGSGPAPSVKLALPRVFKQPLRSSTMRSGRMAAAACRTSSSWPAHGGHGRAWGTLWFVDGPDEVDDRAIARAEFPRHGVAR